MQKQKSRNQGVKVITSADYEKILAALNDTKYKYRTITGISKSTGLNREIIKQEISKHGEDIVVLSRRNQQRERLYTTREHYQNTASLKEKIIGAFINGIY